MKLLSIFLIATVNYSAHSQNELKDDRAAKEQYIAVSREKLALEIEMRKVKALLQATDLKLQEVKKENKDLEKELAHAEKELSSSESQKDKLEDQVKLYQKILNQISTVIKQSN